MALTVVALAGCNAGTGPRTSPDSTPAAVAVPPDSALGQPPVPEQADTARSAAAADTSALEGLRSDIAELAVGLEAVRRSTDSLRASLGAARPVPATEAVPPGQLSGAELLEDAGQTARRYGLRAFWAVVVLGLAFYLVKFIVHVLDRLAERSAQRRLFYKRLVPVARILFWTLALIVVIRNIFQVDAAGLLAAFAAIGVAVGFAAQDLLKNIFGGLVIVFDQPFQVGDKIEVAGTYGEVVSIGLRSTRIVTPDDSIVSVPNAQVVDNQVSNANSGALDCQVVTDLYLPGWVDETEAKKIAFQVAASSPWVFLGKPIVVLVRDEFKETFITHIKVKAYVIDTRHEFRFMSDITERARAEFRRHGLLQPMHGARAWIDISAMRDKDAGPEGAGP